MGYESGRRPYGAKGKKIFRLKWESDGETHSYEILDDALISFREYYAVMKRTDKATGETVVFGMANRVHLSKDEYGTRCGDTEHCGPSIDNCPKRLIELLERLAPLDPDDEKNAYAIDWRARCLAKIAGRKTAKEKVPPGTAIRFEQGLEFRGYGKVRSFVRIGPTRWRRDAWKGFSEENGEEFLCRLPKDWHSRPYVIPATSHDRIQAAAAMLERRERAGERKKR
jgi:hypothetical protein